MYLLLQFEYSTDQSFWFLIMFRNFKSETVFTFFYLRIARFIVILCVYKEKKEKKKFTININFSTFSDG